MSDFFKQHRELLIPVLFLLCAVLFAAMLPPAPIWITDSGNKYMVMQNFVDRGSMYFDHPLPEFFHYCGFHFQQLASGKLVSFFPATLPAITAPLWKIAGDTAVCWIPMLSAAIILLAMQKLLPERKYPLAAMIAASPLLFYAVQFWEMIPAAAAVTAAAWMFREKKYFYGGIIFGAGVWMREELYLLGAAFGIALMCQKQWRQMWYFAAGAAIPVLLLWAVNQSSYGHFLGTHSQTNFHNNRPADAVLWRDICFNYYQQLIRFDTAGKISLFLIPAALATAFAAGFAPSFKRWKPLKLLAAYLCGAAVIFSAISLLRSEDPLYITGQTAGLFIAFPVAIPVLMNHRALCRSQVKTVTLLSLTVIIFILLVPPWLNRYDIGLTWSSRHYIVIMPLLSILSYYSAKCSGWMKGCGKSFPLLLLIAGAVMQIWALTALYKVSHRCAEVENIIRETPGDIVVSELFFLPEMTPHIPQEKLWLEVTDEKKTADLLNRFEKGGVQNFTLLLSASPDLRRIPDEALAMLLAKYPPVEPPRKYAISSRIKIFVVKCAKKP